MKIFKKISLGLSVLGFAFLSLLGVLPAEVSAAPNFNMQFADSGGKTITGKYNNVAFEMDLYPPSESSPTWQYQISTSKPGLICSGSFIAITSDRASTAAASNATPLAFRYKASSSTSCTSYTSQIPVAAFGNAPPPKQLGEINWTGAKGKLSGSDNSHPNTLTVTFSDKTTAVFKDKNSNDGTINFKPTSTGTTKIGGLTISSWCGNTAYGSGDSSYGLSMGSYTDTTATVNVCYNLGVQSVTQPSQNEPAINIPIDSSAYKPGGGGNGGGGSTQNDCEGLATTNNIAGHELAFVACPMIDAAQSISDGLLGIVQGQLSFTFANNIGKSIPQVRGAWAQMRDLASVFLVIIMLVMVLSQAVSWGPFDAYTVRKVLPKLVIAVIMMQVSWSLLSWIVQVFDDIGHGIQYLIYEPFGGSNNLELGVLLGKAGLSATQVGGVGLAGLIGFSAIAVLSLPTIALIGWSIVLALFTAWITLAVRQIFIIALVIFAPLAMLAWILPGTEKYWKMWYQNFTKLMAMFPLIVGMIAVGRVFGWITATSTDYQLLKFVMILIGYFGPFFLIPKAFKWGGQMMSLAGQGISNTTPKLGGPVTNWLKGEQERSMWNQSRQRRKAQLQRRAEEKWATGMTRGRYDPRGYVARARGAGLRSVGVPQRVPGLKHLTPWVRGDKDVRQKIVYGAEATAEKSQKEQAQEVLGHYMRQDAFRAGDMREIIQRMGIEGSEGEQEALLGKLLSTRNVPALNLYFTQRGTRHDTDEAYRRTISKDDSGGLGRTASEIGLSPF